MRQCLASQGTHDNGSVVLTEFRSIWIFCICHRVLGVTARFLASCRKRNRTVSYRGFSSSFRSPSHLRSRGRDKLERPLQLPQASTQLLPNRRPIRPCCPSLLIKEWTVLEDVAHCLLTLDHTGTYGVLERWQQTVANHHLPPENWPLPTSLL